MKTFFFTSTVLDWKPLLNNTCLKSIILDSLTFLGNDKQNPLHIHGFVIMPNHLHLLLSVKNHEDIKRFQFRFLKFTGQKLIYYLKDHNSEKLKEYLSTNGDRKYQVWQRNSKIIELEGLEKQLKVLDYIHNNPVQKKWMLANSPIDYKFSSALFYEKGLSEFTFLKHIDMIN